MIANNVGQFKEDIVEGETGLVSKGTDADDLSDAIERFIKSPMLQNDSTHREAIKKYAQKKYSWDSIAETIVDVYRKVGES